MRKLAIVLLLCGFTQLYPQLGFYNIIKQGETTPALFFKPDYNYYSMQVNFPFTILHQDKFNLKRMNFSFSGLLTMAPAFVIAAVSRETNLSIDSGWGRIIFPAILFPFLVLNSQHYFNFTPHGPNEKRYVYFSSFVGSQLDSYLFGANQDVWHRYTLSFGMELFIPVSRKINQSQLPGIAFQAGISKNWDINEITRNGETKPFGCLKVYWNPW